MQTLAEQVLEWIEAYIETNHLGIGDSLPHEYDIVAETGVGRSSVREALTALKVLGIIQSKRKGGITIIRDPVMLGLRHYFTDRYEQAARYEDVLEFRAAMEWGLGPLTLSRVKKSTLRALRAVLKSVSPETADAEVLTRAEIEFHRLVTTGCGNRLAGLLVHLYEPLFRSRLHVTANTIVGNADYARAWVAQHAAMVEALAAGDSARFLSHLRKHTFGYMRGLKA